MLTPEIKPKLPLMASEVARECRLSDDALALLVPDPYAVAFVQTLCDKALQLDATVFLAHVLAPRVPDRAIWWGCLCAWWVYRVARPKPAERAALQAAVRWVQKPGEERRRAAEAAGWAADLTNPAGCLALAAFWTGDNIAPAGAGTLAPPPELVGKTLAGGLQLAAALGEKSGLKNPYRKFVALALEIDKGRIGWKLT